MTGGKLRTKNFSAHLEVAAISGNQLIFQIYKPFKSAKNHISQHFTQPQDHLQVSVTTLKIAKTHRLGHAEQANNLSGLY